MGKSFVQVERVMPEESLAKLREGNGAFADKAQKLAAVVDVGDQTALSR